MFRLRLRPAAIPAVRRIALHAVLGSLIACGGGEATGVTPVPPPIAGPRVVLTASATSAGIGDAIQVTPTVYQTGGAVLVGAVPMYAVSDSAKATVDIAGRVTGFATGTVDVIATYGVTVGRLTLTFTSGTGAWSDGTLYGTSNNEGGENVVADATGNVYVAGSAASASAGGGSDAFVTRFLPNGKQAWTRQITTAAQDGANGIALHRDGGVVVNSSNVFGSQVSRLDAAGRIVWTYALLSGAFNDIVTDASGNSYVTGASIRSNAGSACPGVPLPLPNSVTVGGAGDGLLLKLSPTGALLWCRVWSYAMADQPDPRIPVFDMQGVSLAIDESRNALYVGGVMQVNAFFGLIPYMRRMALSDGAPSWTKFVNPGGLGDDPAGRPLTSQTVGIALLHGLAVDRAGDVWAALNEDSLTVSSTWRYSAYVVKVSPDGAERLRRDVSVPDATFTRAVNAITYRAAQNDIVVVASYGDVFTRRGNYTNGTIVALDMSAVEKWRTVIAGTPSVIAVTPGTSVRGITASASGDVFVTGETTGNFAGVTNSAVAANRGGFDVLVGRITGRP